MLHSKPDESSNHTRTVARPSERRGAAVCACMRNDARRASGPSRPPSCPTRSTARAAHVAAGRFNHSACTWTKKVK